MTICAMCNKPINSGHIVAEGPCKESPGTKFYHVGCVRLRERQRIASATPSRLPAEAGENRC